MLSLRKLMRKPRIDDWSPLAKFYYADEALIAVANELDSFDARRDPERCNQLVAKLRQAQDRLLHIICMIPSSFFYYLLYHKCNFSTTFLIPFCLKLLLIPRYYFYFS